MFKHLFKWFFRRFDVEAYGNKVTEIFLLHLPAARSDIRGHVTSSLQLKMVPYVWIERTKSERKIKEENTTAILDSKQTDLLNLLLMHFALFYGKYQQIQIIISWNFTNITFILQTWNCSGNVASAWSWKTELTSWRPAASCGCWGRAGVCSARAKQKHQGDKNEKKTKIDSSQFWQHSLTC